MHIYLLQKQTLNRASVPREISNPTVEGNIKNIAVIHGAYKTVGIYHVERVKISCGKMQICLDAGGINKC